MISTHTPHARRDAFGQEKTLLVRRFLLTRLMRGVTEQGDFNGPAGEFLLTRLMRGVTASGMLAKRAK